MIYKASELKSKLRHLILVGQDEEGDIEFMGTNEEFRKAEDEIKLSEFTKNYKETNDPIWLSRINQITGVLDLDISRDGLFNR